jgi:hypothetical protein
MREKFRKTAALILCLAVGSAAAPGAQQPRRGRPSVQPRRLTQAETIRFPRAGDVQVRVTEAPFALPRLEFVSEATTRSVKLVNLGTSDPRSYRPTEELGKSLIEPFARFMPLGADGFPSPLVLAVAVRPGGSDHGFESTLVGETNGALRVLTPRPLVNSIQGGVFVGELGKGYGPGMAVWTFVWGDDEAHYDEHVYTVQLYRFDRRSGLLRRAASLRSRRKHRAAADALAELGLPRYANLLDNFPAIKDYRS